MPSGCTPTDAFKCPMDYQGEALGVKVPMDILGQIRAQLPVTREEAFRWVDGEFAAVADELYIHLGSPRLTLEGGWDIFSRMSVQLTRVYNTAV